MFDQKVSEIFRSVFEKEKKRKILTAFYCYIQFYLFWQKALRFLKLEFHSDIWNIIYFFIGRNSEEWMKFKATSFYKRELICWRECCKLEIPFAAHILLLKRNNWSLSKVRFINGAYFLVNVYTISTISQSTWRIIITVQFTIKVNEQYLHNFCFCSFIIVFQIL